MFKNYFIAYLHEDFVNAVKVTHNERFMSNLAASLTGRISQTHMTVDNQGQGVQERGIRASLCRAVRDKQAEREIRPTPEQAEREIRPTHKQADCKIKLNHKQSD